MALLERGDATNASKVRAMVIPVAAQDELHGAIKAHVQPGTTVNTDGWKGYNGLPDDYVHEFVDHAIEYVRDTVHTNGLENFFSLLKRMVKGTYVSISPWHMDKYIDEQSFRYRERKDENGDAGRFVTAIGGMRDKRVTYQQLIHSFGLAQPTEARTEA